MGASKGRRPAPAGPRAARGGGAEWEAPVGGLSPGDQDRTQVPPGSTRKLRFRGSSHDVHSTVEEGRGAQPTRENRRDKQE
jgi:hypothetical protein